MKTKRISVPVPAETERKAREISAKTGQSIAQVLTEFLTAGRDKKSVAEVLADLKHDGNSVNQIAEMLSGWRDEDRATKTSESSRNRTGFFLPFPQEAAENLIESAFFSAAVVSEMAAADMPGAARQPMHFYLRAAREKTTAKMTHFRALIAEKGEQK